MSMNYWGSLGIMLVDLEFSMLTCLDSERV